MKKLFALMLTTAVVILGGAEKTIVFVGDSISCGVGASSKNTRFSTVAVKLLSAGEIKYNEKNIAISGSTMCDQLWPVFKASGYPYRLNDVLKIKPDVLVLQHGVNDNGVRCSLADYVWSYRQFVREVKKALPNTRIICMTITPTWRSPENMQWLAMANAAIQEIAARENCVVVQINQALDGKKNFFPDRLHPNDEGHKLMAETLAAAIKDNRVRNSECFDFSIRLAGTYHVCNWTFKISEAADKGGYTTFKDMGKGGFTYSSFGPVTLISPMNYYSSPFVCKADGLPENLKFSWGSYSKNGTFDLPSTNGKMVKVTISDLPDLTESLTVDLSSLETLKKEFILTANPKYSQVACADGVITLTATAANREIRLMSKRKFRNTRLEFEANFDHTGTGYAAYFGFVTTLPWHYDSAWLMGAASEGSFYVHAKGQANANSNKVRIGKIGTEKWHKFVIDYASDGATLQVDDVELGKVTDAAILPDAKMPVVFSMQCKKAPFTIKIRKLKLTPGIRK